MHKNILVLFALLLVCLHGPAQTVPPYKNSLLPVDERVKDLLSRMTIEEKFWQLFMIPGEVEKGQEDNYHNGIFGFQVSAASKNGDAAQQLLQYGTAEDALSLAKQSPAVPSVIDPYSGVPLG